MASRPRNDLTPEQYLEIERKAEFKSEYFAGEMFAMPGVKRAHAKLSANLGLLLGDQRRSPVCDALMSDLRVRVSETGLYTCPDVVVACREDEYLDGELATLFKPVLVAGALSPSTEAYDRGRRFEHYRTIGTLRQRLLVSQDRMPVDVFTLENGRWVLIAARKMSSNWLLFRAASD